MKMEIEQDERDEVEDVMVALALSLLPDIQHFDLQINERLKELGTKSAGCGRLVVSQEQASSILVVPATVCAILGACNP